MNRVFENASALFLAHLVGLLSSGLTLLIMPRYFSEEALGSYFLAVFVTNMIASVIELGMQGPLIREMTLHLQQARHFVGNALIIRILLSIVAWGLMVGVGYLLGYPPSTLRMIQLLGLAEVINAIAQLFRCVFRAFEQMKYEAFTVVVERSVVVLVGGLGIIFHGIHIVDFCVIVLIASFVNLVLSTGIVLKRFTSLRFDLDFGVWRRLMSQALPFALGNVFNLIYLRIDVIMLSRLSPHGVAATAWYGLAYTFVHAFTRLPGAFMGAMFPVMSRSFEDKKGDFTAVYTHAFRWVFLMGAPFAVGMAALGRGIALTLFPRYDRKTIAPALSLLSWAGGLNFLTILVHTVLRAADKRRAFSLLMGTTALLNIALNVILIPRFSHVGAAVTMIFSETYLVLVGVIYISRNIAQLARVGFAIKAILVATAMGLALMFLRDHFSVWGLIPLSIAFYWAAMAILGETRWSVPEK
ncbi:MAG: flippase [Candidatus Poribacteria bacterium]|nr:flippase [Candidatus Poribacteria bacterium]